MKYLTLSESGFWANNALQSSEVSTKGSDASEIKPLFFITSEILILAWIFAFPLILLNPSRSDSPNLYFAIQPNGDFSPCCDFRIEEKISVADISFPNLFYSADFRNKVNNVVGVCTGCMYGSYPEMSISMRFMYAKIQRIKTFFIF